MQLNRFTDYGLRVLMFLYGCDNERVTIEHIATRFDIPHNHLNKIVNRMVKLGWIVSKPGRNGGIQLATLAEPLRLGDVLRTLEDHPALINCSEPPCPLRTGCHLKRALEEGREAFYADMNRHILPDLVTPPTSSLLVRLHRA